jgi:hypothetical protein
LSVTQFFSRPHHTVGDRSHRFQLFDRFGQGCLDRSGVALIGLLP